MEDLGLRGSSSLGAFGLQVHVPSSGFTVKSSNVPYEDRAQGRPYDLGFRVRALGLGFLGYNMDLRAEGFALGMGLQTFDLCLF